MSLRAARLLPREKAAMRRQVILDTLRAHPLSNSRELSERFLRETGGPPCILTGGLFIAPHKVYACLRALEATGQVIRFQSAEQRFISWQVAA